MTIGGVAITRDILGAMLQAAVAVEHHIERKLTAAELDLIILTTLRCIASRRPPAETLH